MRIKLLIGLIVTVAVIGVSYAVTRPSHVHLNMSMPSGAISGHVMDAQGQPVPGAEVVALGESGSIGRLPVAITDETGEFLLNRLVPDTYTLSVAKEEDDYPHTHIPLYSAGLTTNIRVTLSEQQTISGITLYLGPKAARLTGRILDASTSKPIKGVQNLKMTLRRVDNPDYFYTTGPDIDGSFSILVPTVPFTIEVSAPGYQSWTYGEDNGGNRSDSLKLNPGEVKKLNIALRRQNRSQ